MKIGGAVVMEKVVSREHSLTMMNRANMSLSGVTEVSEFSHHLPQPPPKKVLQLSEML